MSLPNKIIRGVLILSEMAGASVELSDALLINPNDTDQIEQAICRALKMPLEEQREKASANASHPFGSNRKQNGLRIS